MNKNKLKLIIFYAFVGIMMLFFTRCETTSSKRVVKDTLSTANLSKDNFDMDVSFIDLISNPQLYSGKSIRIIGYLNVEFEGNALYFHQEDYILGNDKNAFWLDLSNQEMHSKRYQNANKKYVILEGVFDMQDKGNTDSYHGTIKKITRVDIWK